MTDNDLVSRHLLERIALIIARLLFQLDVAEVTLLEIQNQYLEMWRSDLLLKVTDAEGRYLLHMDIQNTPQKMIAWQMLRYRIDIALQYGFVPVQQFMVYTGHEPLSITNGIQEPGLNYVYRLIDMHTLDYQTLLAQDTPDALVIAILCHFGDTPANEAVRNILKRLLTLTENDESAFRDYLLMLEILSTTNSNLKKIMQEEAAMLSQVKYSDLPSYELGLQKGFQKGLKKGRQDKVEEDIEDGRQAERYAIAIQLLCLLDDATIAAKTGLRESEVASLRRV